MTTVGLQIEVTDAVGTVTFTRPKALNALDVATKTALLAGLGELAADEGVRCVVLTGTGRAFCAGQDLREHVEGLLHSSAEAVWRTVPEQYNPIALALHRMDKPVLAAVNGVAAGAGASLAFLADVRLLAASATFTLAFAGVGLSCDTGCSWTLPRLVGAGRAMELLLSGRRVSAAEALELGLATEVVPDEEFAARVAERARTLAAGPSLAYGAIRQAVGYAAGVPLADALGFEAEQMRRTGASADHRSAVEAFLAKRPPEFSGR